MSYFKLDNPAHSGRTTVVQTDCPHCSKAGTFDLAGASDIANGIWVFGLRKCPNPNCKGLLFFGKGTQAPHNSTLITYPSSKIMFDKTGIPLSILRSFEEAITCHSTECFIASAIMLRKTLEGICEDKGATGTNLFKRLESLSKIIVIPNELIEATHELRLLGNDAAHLEAQTYEQIGKNEIEISIEFTKEILKAVYQYQSLLGKLRSLKIPKSEA